MAVYGYARVSTINQAEKGESLDVQQRTLGGYATMHGMTVAHCFVERGVSGSKPLADRPEGSALLAALQPGDVVITPKLDRMFRSALDALDMLRRFQAQRVTLHMIDLGGDVTGNGISKLVFTILSAVAESERDRIRERVQTVKTDQKSRGRYLGGIVPFGKRIGAEGDLIDLPEQLQAIHSMHAMRAAGASYRAISDAMRAEGHTLSHEAVRLILGRTTD